MKLLTIIALLQILFFLKANSFKNNVVTDSFNIKQFGAVGDGNHDDYMALKQASQFITKRTKGILFFPRGTYFISEYHTSQNNFPDIVFSNCNGLKLIGDNAVISVNGKINRKADYTKNNYLYSNTNSIIPLAIDSCNNVIIRGFEINGNVDKMIKDENVVESRAHLIQLINCDNVLIENVFIHHAQTDGIYISGNSANVKMINVTSANNGRQGMSIISLTNGNFENCKFINTGITGGNYGYHKPGAGVDIEPGANKSNKVNGIIFNNCIFKNNIGGQLLCTSPSSTSNISVNNSKFSAENSSSKYQMILAAYKVNITGCSIDCGKGNIYAVWKKLPGSNTTISNCTINGDSNGILAVSGNMSDTVYVLNNRFNFTGDSLTGFFPYLNLKNLSFENNQIYVPSNVFVLQKLMFWINGIKKSDNNKFIYNK